MQSRPQSTCKSHSWVTYSASPSVDTDPTTKTSGSGVNTTQLLRRQIALGHTVCVRVCVCVSPEVQEAHLAWWLLLNVLAAVQAHHHRHLSASLSPSSLLLPPICPQLSLALEMCRTCCCQLFRQFPPLLTSSVR